MLPHFLAGDCGQAPGSSRGVGPCQHRLLEELALGKAVILHFIDELPSLLRFGGGVPRHILGRCSWKALGQEECDTVPKGRGFHRNLQGRGGKRLIPLLRVKHLLGWEG